MPTFPPTPYSPGRIAVTKIPASFDIELLDPPANPQGGPDPTGYVPTLWDNPASGSPLPPNVTWRRNFDGIRVPFFGAHVACTAALSTANVTPLVMPFDTIKRLSDDNPANPQPYFAAANNTQVVIPRPGRHEIKLSGVIFTSNPAGARNVKIKLTRGGTAYVLAEWDGIASQGGNTFVPPMVTELDCNTGDVITVEILQTSGGTLTTIPRAFSASELSVRLVADPVTWSPPIF